MTGEQEDNGESADPMLVETHSEHLSMQDKFYRIYILFYSLGIATQVPSNFFMTATDYWMYKFRDTSSVIYNTSNTNRTGLQAEFISDYSIVAHVGSIIFAIATFGILRRLSIVKRTIGALSGAISMFAITCLFVQVNTDSWQRGFFIMTLSIAFFLTGFCTVCMVTLFELVVKFPPKYLGAILSGHSICGIFAALVQIFSLGIGATSTTTGVVYFSIGMLFVFMTLVAFLTSLTQSTFFNYHLNKQIVTETPKMNKEIFLRVLNKIKFYMLSMILVLGCTIMIHPGVTSLVVSVDKGSGYKWNDVFFVPVITFLLYFVCDYIGRELAAVLKMPTNGLIIFAISCCRIALVPMLMLCNAHPRQHLPVVFNEDFLYIIFILIFGFSNGYLVNLCVIQVPMITEDDEKKIAMFLIVIFMVVSLGACSFLSAVMVKAL